MIFHSYSLITYTSEHMYHLIHNILHYTENYVIFRYIQPLTKLLMVTYLPSLLATRQTYKIFGALKSFTI